MSFTYNDMFGLTDIDMKNWIENFSPDEYTIEFSNFQPVMTDMVNLFQKIKFTMQGKTGLTFTTYKIEEGEKIDHVSQKFYDTRDNWWVILMVNNITNPIYQWPLMDNQLKELAAELVDKEGKYPYEIYYNLLFENNESKRDIIMIKGEQVDSLINEIRDFVKVNK